MSEITKEKLLADFKVLLNDAEQLIGATAGDVGDRIAEVRRQLARRVEEGKAALGRREAELRGQAQRAKSQAVELIRNDGWGWLAAAAFFGMLASLALYYQKRGSSKRET